jgi:hypothetical protein
MNKYFLILTLFTCLGLSKLKAQGNIETVQIEAVGDKERTVTPSVKITSEPATYDSVIKLPPVTYQTIPVKADVSYAPEQIQPAKLNVLEPLDKLYPGYIKGGFGNYTSMFLDAYYGSTRSRTNVWNANLKHHSALGQINDVGKTAFADNLAAFNYKHFFSKHTLELGAKYERNGLNYYGFPKNDTLIDSVYKTNENIRQTYNFVQAHAGFGTNFSDSFKIKHFTELDYSFLTDRYGVNEHRVLVSNKLRKFIDSEYYGLSTVIDFNSYRQPVFNDFYNNSLTDKTWNNAVISLNPHISSYGDKWKVKAGLILTADIGEASSFHFYPDVEGRYVLFNGIFIPYAGITGGIQRNTFDKFRRENPFILSMQEMQNTNQRYRLYGGIRGSISSKFTFNTEVAAEKYSNFVLWGVDSSFSYQNRFVAVYDGSMSYMRLLAEATWLQSDKIRIAAKGEYYLYSPTDEDHAWQLPAFRQEISAIYDLADKLIVRFDVFYWSRRKAYLWSLPSDNALVNTENAVLTNGKYVLDLKGFADINLGVEYRYNKRISAFINVNNLTTVKYQCWLNYPYFGLNVLGGATWRF